MDIGVARARLMYPVDNERMRLTFCPSGIFGYINYLVEKDRKYILDTLVNGTKLHSYCRQCIAEEKTRLISLFHDRSFAARVPRL